MSCPHCEGLDHGKAGRPYFDCEGNSLALVWFPGEPNPTLAVNINARGPEYCAGVMVPCCPVCGRRVGDAE